MSIPTLGSPSNLNQARSPIYLTGKNNTIGGGPGIQDELNSMSVDMEIYSGAKTPAPSTSDYQLEKVVAVDQVINYELSALIRDKFLHPMGLSNITVATKSEDKEVLWVHADGDWTYRDAGATAVTAIWGDSYFLATDGWLKRGEAIAGITQARLAAPRTHYVTSTSNQTLAVFFDSSNGLDGFSIEIGANQYWYSLESVIGASNTSEESRNKVIYIPAGAANIGTMTGETPTGKYKINLHFNNSGMDYKARVENDGGTCEAFNCMMEAIQALGDTGTSETINYEVICEDKYTPVTMQWVNKYGVSDYITFFKAQQESGNYTNDTYQSKPYEDAFTARNYTEGRYRDYNVNSRNQLIVNTGWVDEAYDDVIQDLLMSEKVAMLVGSNWEAINPQRGSVQYFKEVNDKNINYTLTFDLGHNERS